MSTFTLHCITLLGRACTLGASPSPRFTITHPIWIPLAHPYFLCASSGLGVRFEAADSKQEVTRSWRSLYGLSAIYSIPIAYYVTLCRGVGTRGGRRGRQPPPPPPENLTKGAGTFYYTAVQCSTARSVDLRVRASSRRVRASSRRVRARATLRVPAQHAWEGSCK